MPKQSLQLLWEKYITANASKIEVDMLFTALKENENADNSDAILRDFLQNTPPSTDWDENYWNQVALRIVRKENNQRSPVKRLICLKHWYAAAAIILLFSAVFLLINRNTQEEVKLNAEIIQVQPGREGAELTLSDGSRILLDTLKNGAVTNEQGAIVRKIDGKLVYEGSGEKVVYNTVSTPRGREFRVSLPDGTLVWLNAASSIRYPIRFTDNERKVEISGEVYFEVAGNSGHPFRVIVNNQAEVEVLGTKFNINAYDNEPMINTTLIEGSVRLYGSPLNSLPVKSLIRSVILKPGQQAELPYPTVGNSPAIAVFDNVNIDEVLAWKNGIFNFQNTSFAQAMRQLERWYDINVSYPNGIPADVELNGEITKGVTITDLIDILSKIGVKCRLDGRNLIVLKRTS